MKASSFVVFASRQHYLASLECVTKQRITDEPCLETPASKGEKKIFRSFAIKPHLTNELNELDKYEDLIEPSASEQERLAEEKKKDGLTKLQILIKKTQHNAAGLFLFLHILPLDEMDFIRHEDPEKTTMKHNQAHVFHIQTRDYAYHYFSAASAEDAAIWVDLLSKASVIVKESRRHKETEQIPVNTRFDPAQVDCIMKPASNPFEITDTSKQHSESRRKLTQGKRSAVMLSKEHMRLDITNS